MSGFCFFNDTATTEIYTLSLHDALPIWAPRVLPGPTRASAPPPHRRRHASSAHRGRDHREGRSPGRRARRGEQDPPGPRSEEHTSELQSRQYLVCRLLLEKKKKNHHCIH